MLFGYAKAGLQNERLKESGSFAGFKVIGSFIYFRLVRFPAFHRELTTTTSSARYRLRPHCRDLKILG
jgi:hypothetical protein